jgi:hypothetical protein
VIGGVHLAVAAVATVDAVRKIAPWSIHNSNHRIVLKLTGSREWVYSWRDIDRDNDFRNLEQRFDTLVEQQ